VPRTFIIAEHDTETGIISIPASSNGLVYENDEFIIGTYYGALVGHTTDKLTVGAQETIEKELDRTSGVKDVALLKAIGIDAKDILKLKKEGLI